MTDAIKAIAEWIVTEPESTEVIIIRRRGGEFHVKLEYGDRTTIPSVAVDLADALTIATERAHKLPSSARYYGEREPKKKSFRTPVKPSMSGMPGLSKPKGMPGMN